MTVAHVIFDLSVGGMERLVVALATVQHQAGMRVLVYCIADRGALAAELEAIGIGVHPLRKRPGPDLGLLWSLRSAFRRERVSVVHTHNNVAGLYGAIAGWLARVPMRLNTRHGMADLPENARGERVYRLAVAFLTRVAFVCDRARELSCARGIVPRRKAIVVGNGIDLTPFAEPRPAAGAALRAAWGIPAGAPLVGTVCRLSAAKDLPTLVHAMRGVGVRHPAAHLVIVGEGEEEVALRGLIAAEQLADRIHLVGQRDDVADVLAALDLFVLPSQSEGMSLALLEAAAAGVPIVATDVGASAEIVRDGESGWIVPAGDRGRMADAITRLLDDPALARRMGDRGRARAMAEFGIERTHEAYAAVYAGG